MDPKKSRLAACFTTAQVALVSLFVAFASPAQAQALRTDQDLGAQWLVNSTAKLLSGLSPMYPGHITFSETDAWKEHSAHMKAAWARMNEKQVSTMTAWRDGAVSRTCPAGKTLLYPFSGPDFFNAYWLFPDCETYVMFGLEHIGEVPDLERMNEVQFARMLADVRSATTDFFSRNYFITENMSRQLRTAQLRGVIPLFMIPMALSGVDILRIRPFEFPATMRTVSVAPGRPMRNLKGITIEFRSPGSPVTRRVNYFTVDVTDKGLAHYPEFMTYIRSLGTTTTFIKSASYLLHSNEFRQIRTALLDQSGFIVQDDSGLPYPMLEARGWKMNLHGRYGVPIPPFQGAFQPSLDKAYKVQNSAPLPFTFGYQFHDARDERSNVMVGQRPLQVVQVDEAIQQRVRSTRKASVQRAAQKRIY
jgi:hypothetical protein